MKNEKSFSILSKSDKFTLKTARKFAKRLKAGDVVCLVGDLGAGKTVFAKGVVSAFSKSVVSSPTFTLVNEYVGKKINICHFDFYRIKSPKELEGIGVEEYLFGDNICLVEWPELAPLLFDKVWTVNISKVDEKTRRIKISYGSFNDRSAK